MKKGVIIGILLLGIFLLSLSFASAHSWFFDYGSRPYNLTSNYMYNASTGKYIINATFKMDNYSPIAKTAWCAGTISQCCPEGYDPATKQCRTGMNYATSDAATGWGCCSFTEGCTVMDCSTPGDYYHGCPNTNYISSTVASGVYNETMTFETTNLTNFIVVASYKTPSSFHASDNPACSAPIGVFSTPSTSCGDGKCDANENCSTCEQDCGKCCSGILTTYKNITLSPATPYNDYQVMVRLNALTFNYSKARSDGGDIRFYDPNGNSLSYWIDSWNLAGVSTIWVKVPSAGTTQIKMTYGDPTLTSQSNGNATMVFYEDFANGINTTKWGNHTSGGVISVSSRELVEGYSGSGNSGSGCDGACYGVNVYTKTDLDLANEGYAIDFHYRYPSTYVDANGPGIILVDKNSVTFSGGQPYDYPDKYSYLYGIKPGHGSQAVQNCEARILLYNSTKYKIENVSGDCTTYSTYPFNTLLDITFPHGVIVPNSVDFMQAEYGGNPIYHSNIRIRKYSANNPVATPAVEETSCSSCASSQVIMKLYNSTNAHGALWNDSSYSYDICYNKIFGTQYSGANPHNCTANNKVLWLYQNNNSHASTTNANGYSVPVCYGNLNCHSTTGNCNSGEQVVARLYQQTNSHISNASDSNYGIKICCSTVAVSTARWEDSNGNVITNQTLNSTANMVVDNSGAGSIVYSLEKKDGSNWNFVANLTKVANAGFRNSQPWVAYPEGIYRFRAFVPSFGVAISGELNASGLRNSTPPIVNLTHPMCGQDFKVNESFEAIVNISDPSDIISASINFTDGSPLVLLTNGVTTILHNYSTPGTKQIIIDANDSDGTPTVRYRIKKMVNIIIIDNNSDGRYIAACIEKPENGEVFDRSTVDFSANKTTAFFFNATTQQKTNYSLDSLRFIWVFSDIGTNVETATFLGNTYNILNPAAGINETGTNPLMRGYQLTKVYPRAGYNSGKLTVEFVN